VCYSVLGKSPPKNLPRTGQIFWFIIKTYKTNGLTEKLDQIPVASSMTSIKDTEEKSDLKISSPQGSFDTRFLSRYKDTSFSILVMFAAGTGITPMSRILLDISKRLEAGEPSSHSHAVLLFWNKMEDDIIWGEEFLALSHTTTKSNKKGKGNKWFSYFPVLTQPTSSWKGLTGRPSQEHVAIVQNLMPEEETAHYGKQALICGPTGFCQSVQTIIGENLFTEENVYVFKG